MGCWAICCYSPQTLAEDAFGGASSSAYRSHRELPIAVSQLPFYQEKAAWQCQWQNLQQSAGESLLIQDEAGETVGYALFKRLFNEAGEHQRTLLFQLEVDHGREDAEAIVRYALREVFAPLGEPLTRMTFNFNVENELVVRLLQEAGFKEGNTQVLMERVMEKSV